MTEKICPVCGQSFVPNHGRQKYCCRECARVAQLKHAQKWYRSHGRHSSVLKQGRENWRRISEMNDRARALGLHYGTYRALISIGKNPEDYRRV